LATVLAGFLFAIPWPASAVPAAAHTGTLTVNDTADEQDANPLTKHAPPCTTPAPCGRQ
jgi:hypothetical protein